MSIRDLAVSVVVPVYRSQATLHELHQRLSQALSETGLGYEIILVDDASPDDSWSIMKELRQTDERVKIIQHMRNFGQHQALLCGMAHSCGEIIITMDDDLQHPPEEIPKLLNALQEDDEIDAVLGAYNVKRHNVFRNLATGLLVSITNWVFQNDRSLPITSFRAIRWAVVEQMLLDQSIYPRINFMLLGITNRIQGVPVRHEPRKHGNSTYSLRRLTSDAMTNILSNSSLPLQLISYIGFASSILSFLLAIYYLYRYFSGGILVAGWTTLVLLTLFTSGMMLFSFGVVGEYLIRILKEVRKPPRYIIRSKEL